MKQDAESPGRAVAEAHDPGGTPSARVLAAMLPRWQGLLGPARGHAAVMDAVTRLRGAALPFSVLERDILPARVVDYAPALLDQLCAEGEVAWQGCERLGERDGRIALFPRAQLPALGRIRVPVTDSAASAIRDLLASRGPLGFEQMVAALGGFPPDLLRALWRLVWNGEVTSDSLRPLRRLQGGRDRVRRGRRTAGTASRYRRAPPPGSQGCWSLVAGPDRGFAGPRLRGEALARCLLDRYGLLGRDLVPAEDVAGGFGSLWPVLEDLLRSGELRHGVFVTGAVQYALPEALACLRDAARGDSSAPLVLAAVDPANAYGAALPWPRARGALRPQRAAGARVVLLGGELLGYLDRSGHSLSCFVGERDPQQLRKLELLAHALAGLARGGEAVVIGDVDGAAPGQTPLDGPLRRASFAASSRGFMRRPGDG